MCEVILDYGVIRQGEEILAKHQELARGNQVLSPYWQYSLPEEFRPPFYEQFARAPFKVLIGSIASFPTEYLAVVVDSTIKSFLEHGLFDSYPTDEQSMKQLFAVMMGGFDSRRSVVSVMDGQCQRIVGGCMVAPGVGKDTVRDRISKLESSISTLTALEFLTSHPIMGYSEESVVCFTRFYRLPHRLLTSLITPGLEPKDYLGKFSREVLSGMARATQRYAENFGQKISFGLLDTHDPKIKNTLVNYYGGEVITSDTKSAKHMDLPNPLYYHYSIGPIYVVAFEFDKQLEKARGIDVNLGGKGEICQEDLNQIL